LTDHLSLGAPNSTLFFTKASGSLLEFTLASVRGGAGLSQLSDFSLEPSPKLPGNFEAVLEADGHGLKSCQGRAETPRQK